MIVRLVARLAVAIATVIGSANLCWGQAPPTNGAARSTQTPQLTPPQTVEGTWVSDEQPLAAPAEMFDAQELSGMSDYSASPYESQTPEYETGEYETPEYDAEPYEGAECSDSCEDAGGGCAARFLGAFARPFYECRHWDLWDEVHAHRRMWVSVDYLSMWAKGNNLPPLVTTSPNGTPQSQAGVLPVSATTSILYGNGRVDLDQRNGARINFGYWLVDGEFLGIEGQYFALGTQNSGFNSDADILARPFIEVGPGVVTPTENSDLVAFPDYVIGGDTGDLTGSIDIRTVSNIQSANMTLRRLVWIDFTMQRRLDLLLGYRFFRLDDSVTINTASTFASPQLVDDIYYTFQDQWRSINRFHGAEIGLKGQSYHGPVSFEVIAKCAFGNNRQRTWINGFNTLTVGDGATTTNVGGLLTQASNIGSYRRDVFTILPEADANVRFNVTCNLRLVVGYTFIYANRVQRSGDAIDRTLNPTQINGDPLVGEARPAFFATDSTFWLHGFNGGIEYRW